MTLQFVKEVLARRPFQPVRIILAGGESCELRQPEMALLTRNEVLLGTGSTEDGVPAEFKILSIPRISAIVPIGSPGVPQRIPDLHAAAMQTAGDFDEPLPDEFWTGQP
jgi:hypothetical protein